MASESSSFFRQAFSVWERTTAAYFESLARNPLFLSANAWWLNGLMAVKKASDSAAENMISTAGLPTRRDQERALHMLHQIEARLDDMELRERRRQREPELGAEAPAR